MSELRNHAIDVIKGALIVLVVAGHVPPPSNNLYIQILQQWIYIFHMPAFFILGGLYVKKFRLEFNAIYSLLICYIFWLVLYKRSPLIIVQALIYSNWEQIHGLIWFLPAIISFKLMFSISKKKVVNTMALLFFSLLTIIFHEEVQIYHEFIPWGLDISLYLFAMAYICRYFYKSQLTTFEITKSENIRLVICLIAFLAFSLVFYYRVPLNTFTQWKYRVDLAQFSVPGIEGYFYLTGMMVSLIGVGRINMQNNMLALIGRKSLSIFIFHWIVITRFNNYMLPVSGVFTWIFIIVVSVVASIIVSTTLLKINPKFKYLGA